mmetsp:Transcript_74135/g.131093  ORF Transcript_74135/g.131093 Transcript_74135/m.131093 type:complete len:139 (+) Transcript_74135:94-510(+)
MQGRSASSGALEALPKIEPAQATRQIQHLRSEHGGLFSDAPGWSVEAGTSPVVPSRHRVVSRALWGNIAGTYQQFPETTEAKSMLVDHKLKKFGPVKSFVNQQDKFATHREETFKFGNKQIMRLGARPNAPSYQAEGH